MTVLDAFSDVFAVRMRYRIVFFHCCIINVDLPTDATAVTASVSDATEIAVIFRCVKFHNLTSFL
jgi:hypothetical protein